MGRAAADRRRTRGAAGRRVPRRRVGRRRRRRSGCGRASLRRSFASTTRCAGTRRTSATFERLASACSSRARRSIAAPSGSSRQTRFLVSAFRHFERLSRRVGRHRRARAARRRARRSRRAGRGGTSSLTVGDRSRDPYGLCPVDWDLLARVPGLERLDVVVTDAHARRRIPRADSPAAAGHRGSARRARRRRRVRRAAGAARRRAGPRGARSRGGSRRLRALGEAAHARADERRAARSHGARRPSAAAVRLRGARGAAVGRHSVPDVRRAAARGEPYAAALDLVFSFVSSNFARVPAIALLRSPHFRFAGRTTGPPVRSRCYPRIGRGDRRARSRAERRGISRRARRARRLVGGWRAAEPAPRAVAHARRAGETLEQVARELLPLRAPAPLADHLDVPAGVPRRAREPARALTIRCAPGSFARASAILATLGVAARRISAVRRRAGRVRRRGGHGAALD